MYDTVHSSAHYYKKYEKECNMVAARAMYTLLRSDAFLAGSVNRPSADKTFEQMKFLP